MTQQAMLDDLFSQCQRLEARVQRLEARLADIYEEAVDELENVEANGGMAGFATRIMRLARPPIRRER